VRFYGIETDDLTVFMLMDFIEGTTLQAEIFRSRGKSLHKDFIYHTIKSVCSALNYAHKYNFVHCDIKPGNIMIDRHGEVLLTDFGISRMTDAATATMVGFGTPAYMAPELVRGKDPTPQSDIYSLGVVLYEMATGGERPFTGERAQTTGPASEKVRWEQVNLTPLSPTEYNPNIPKELETVILKCLTKDPEERFENAIELMNALELSLTDINSGIAIEADEVNGNVITGLNEQSGSTKQEKLSKNKRNQNLSQPQNAFKKEFSQIPSWLFLIFGSTLVVILMIVAVNLLGGNRQSNSASAVIQNFATKTALPSEESTPIPTTTKTLEPTPTLTTTPTSTPILEVGSTMTNPVDNALMVYVPEGQFIMGSEDRFSWPNEQPSNIIYLDAYWIHQTEVTNSQYRNCIQDGHCSGAIMTFPDDTYPAVHINWFQANSYCEWIGGRLPTEAEWEKAARGSDGWVYTWGDDDPTCELANYSDCGTKAMPVGRHLSGASFYGVLEMAGNVREWVSDFYEEYYYRSIALSNPQGPNSSRFKVIRGGSWYQGAHYLRTSSRQGEDPNYNGNYNGFRCVYLP